MYCWSYLRACQHHDTGPQVVGFDEIAALYRSQRRALVADIVRSLTPLSGAAAYVEAFMPQEVEPAHRSKFMQGVLAELRHLDAARMAGLGISRGELDAGLWRKEGE